MIKYYLHSKEGLDIYYNGKLLTHISEVNKDWFNRDTRGYISNILNNIGYKWLSSGPMERITVRPEPKMIKGDFEYVPKKRRNFQFKTIDFIERYNALVTLFIINNSKEDIKRITEVGDYIFKVELKENFEENGIYKVYKKKPNRSFVEIDGYYICLLNN